MSTEAMRRSEDACGTAMQTLRAAAGQLEKAQEAMQHSGLGGTGLIEVTIRRASIVCHEQHDLIEKALAEHGR